jgi:arginase
MPWPGRSPTRRTRASCRWSWAATARSRSAWWRGSAAAARALAAIEDASGPLIVHFDVDVIDSGELPLGNFPHHGSGVRPAHVTACLQVLRRHPAFAGLVLTEVNPTHDTGGTQLPGYLDTLVTGLTGG